MPVMSRPPDRSALLVLVALVFLPACARDTLGPADDGRLSPDESLALATVLGLETLSFGMARGSVLQGALGQRGPAATGAGETVRVSYDLTRPCLGGGSITSVGTVRAEHDPGPPETDVVDIESTDTHEACVVRAGLTELTLDGDPNVTTMVHAAARGREAWGTQKVTVLGAVTWRADDGRSGRCAVDVLVEVDPDVSTHTRGAVCGHTFDVQVTNG
jgi:hypothetical protein